MEIPRRLQHRPLFRGFPVPYVAMVDSAGTPDFKVLDVERMEECAVRRLCALCGEKLGRFAAFIGGPRHQTHLTFIDARCTWTAPDTRPTRARTSLGSLDTRTTSRIVLEWR